MGLKKSILIWKKFGIHNGSLIVYYSKNLSHNKFQIISKKTVDFEILL